MEVICSILCGWSMCPFGPQQWVFHGVLSSRSRCLAAWGPAVSLGDSLLRSLGNSTFRLGSFDNYSLPLVTEKNPLPLEIVGHRLSSAIKGTVCFAGLPYPGLCLRLDARTRPLPYTGSCLWLAVHTGPHEVPLSISLECLDCLWNMSEWHFPPEQSK